MLIVAMQAKQSLHAKKWSSAHALRLKTVEDQSCTQNLRCTQNLSYNGGEGPHQGEVKGDSLGRSQNPSHSWASSRLESSHNKTKLNNISNNTHKLQQPDKIKRKPPLAKIFTKSQSMGKLSISPDVKSEGSSSDEFTLHARKTKVKKVKEADEELPVYDNKVLHALKAMTGTALETTATPGELKGQCFCSNASAYRYVMYAEPFDHVPHGPAFASRPATETTLVSDSSELLKHSLISDREEEDRGDVFDNRLGK